MTKLTCDIIAEEIEYLWDVIAYYPLSKDGKRIDLQATLNRINQLEAEYKIQRIAEQKESLARYRREGIYGVFIACVIFFLPVYLVSFSILIASIIPILIILANLDVFEKDE